MKDDKKIVQDILRLTKQLLSIPSTPYAYDQLQSVLALAKKELRSFEMENFQNNNIPSILVRNTNKKTKHFKIILNGHLDVVSGSDRLFRPIEQEGRLYGRGAYDMKAAAAVMIILFKHIARELPYPLALQLVTDEEEGGINGTGYQVEHGIRGDFVIIGEAGSNLHIKNQAKGIMQVKLTAQGQSSHSAYPWLGANAIVTIHEAIQTIHRLYPVPANPSWETTVNVVRITTSNESLNKIPEDCAAYIDIRYIPDEADTIIEKIKSVLSPQVSIEILRSAMSTYTHPENEYINLLYTIIKKHSQTPPEISGSHGASDLQYYSAVRCPGIEFGPIGYAHHSDHEWVDINSLLMYYRILEDFLHSLMI